MKPMAATQFILTIAPDKRPRAADACHATETAITGFAASGSSLGHAATMLLTGVCLNSSMNSDE